eukprot:3003442-Prymnesium_polylepis.1
MNSQKYFSGGHRGALFTETTEGLRPPPPFRAPRPRRSASGPSAGAGFRGDDPAVCRQCQREFRPPRGALPPAPRLKAADRLAQRMAHTPPGTRCLCSWQWRPRPIHDSSEGRTSSRVACPGARCVLSRAAAAAGAASGGSTRCESQGRCCRRCAWQRYLWHHGRQREVGGEKLAAVVRRASLRVSVARRTVRRTGERVAPSTLLGCILRPAAAVAAHIDVVGCLAAVDNEVLVPRDE